MQPLWVGPSIYINPVCGLNMKLSLINGILANITQERSHFLLCLCLENAEDILLETDLRGFGDLKIAEHILLHHDDVKAVNTEEAPETVAPAQGNGGVIDGGRLSVKLPALSWNVIRLVK